MGQEIARMLRNPGCEWRMCEWRGQEENPQETEAKANRQFLGVLDFFRVFLEEEWQPPPVFLPGESQGRGSLVGCCLWDRIESGLKSRLK